MTTNKTQKNDTTVIALEGRLDTTTAPQLHDMLIPEFDRVKQIELDLKELVYVSSAGLRVLLMGEKTAKSKGGSMTLTGVSNEIMEVLEMTGLSTILTIA